MYQSWVDATRIRNGSDRDIWAVDHTAHPLLDPDFGVKGSRLLYLTRLSFRRIIRDDDVYRQELARIHFPHLQDLADQLLLVGRQDRLVDLVEVDHHVVVRQVGDGLRAQGLELVADAARVGDLDGSFAIVLTGVETIEQW